MQELALIHISAGAVGLVLLGAKGCLAAGSTLPGVGLSLIHIVQEIGTNTRRQVISESASETIRQIMEFEVGDGTQRCV